MTHRQSCTFWFSQLSAWSWCVLHYNECLSVCLFQQSCDRPERSSCQRHEPKHVCLSDPTDFTEVGVCGFIPDDDSVTCKWSRQRDNPNYSHCLFISPFRQPNLTRSWSQRQHVHTKNLPHITTNYHQSKESVIDPTSFQFWRLEWKIVLAISNKSALIIHWHIWLLMPPCEDQQRRQLHFKHVPRGSLLNSAGFLPTDL